MNAKKISGFSACALIALAAATMALPREVSVVRSAMLDADAATILALAASNEGYQVFNPYKSLDPDLQIALFGPATGIGSGFSFEGKDGTGTQTVAEVTPERVVYAIDLGALGQPTQSIVAQSAGDQTRVTWQIDSDTGYNPVFRVFGLFMDGMVGPTVELGLDNLAEAAA
ncbi:MAG: SRPBCC family protein [Pseudomonadota bacterium]